jgi:hypothetical protein
VWSPLASPVNVDRIAKSIETRSVSRVALVQAFCQSSLCLMAVVWVCVSLGRWMFIVLASGRSVLSDGHGICCLH